MIRIPTAEWAHLPFDVLAWASSAACGVILHRWRLHAETGRLARIVEPPYFGALVVGAILGGWLAGSLNTVREPLAALSHSVVGALAGAIVGVEVYKAVRGIEGSTGGIFAGPFAVGIIVGRWGCLFAGLPDRTYGTPTGLPWGVDLGDGIARHPVQIYESLSMALFLAIYLVGLGRRSDWALTRGFPAMAAWYGVQRFAWEFLKPYPPVVRPLNIFHLISLGVALYGCVFFVRYGNEKRAQDGALPVLRPDDQPLRNVPAPRPVQDHR